MNILTFDIEEWFHLLDHPSTKSENQWSSFPSRIDNNVDRVLSIVQEAGVGATFFCLGWIAEKYPHIVKKIGDMGYEVACHSHTHQLAYKQTPREFRDDLQRAKSTIENVLGRNIDTYRIPGFSLTRDNLWALEIIHDEGFRVDCSVFPASRAHGGLPGFATDKPCLIELSGSNTLMEFPLNTYSVLGRNLVFSGGGYFRLLPYPFLSLLFRRSEYVMTYFHPRDFDPNQPVISDLSLVRRFKSYYGLGSAQFKLGNLLKDFDFVDVRSAVKSLNWTEVDRIPISF